MKTKITKFISWQKITLFITAFIYTFTILTIPVKAALSDEQRKLFEMGVQRFNYDEDVDNGCNVGNTSFDSGSTISIPIGKDNRETTFNFFISKGLSPYIAAGYVGNLMQESGINPKSVNSIGATGIAQWLGGRKANLVKRPNYQDLMVQLDFIWWELNNSEKAAYSKILAAKDLSSITFAIRKFYERPGESEANDANRLKEATKALSQFGTGSSLLDPIATPNPGDPSVPVSPCMSLTGGGSNDQFIDGFTVYSQYDKVWASHPYGSSTIAESGCGPSALAMVITNLKGQRVTPIETADWGSANGTYKPGAGSDWSLFDKGPANWGLKVTPIQASQIANTLSSGALIIASGSGAVPFTPHGHILVIRGITPDGKLRIGDSGHANTSNQSWDFNQLMSETKALWAVRK